MVSNFEEIDEARKILGLKEEAALTEIKKAYYRLALKYHPDKCKDTKKQKCEEIFKKVNKAYKIIMEYCDNYKYLFKKTKEIDKLSESEQFQEHLKKFYHDW